MINFKEFYDERYKVQVKTIRRHLKQDFEQAEDVVQEAYSRAIKYQASYNPKLSSINTWFNSIMFNILRELKNKTQYSESYNEETMSDLWAEERTHEAFEKELNLLKNEKHRHIVELFYRLGYTTVEISQVVPNTTQTNTTTIVSRFRKSLEKKHGVTI